MVDVDHFKLYNDTHGHPAGDEVLRLIARLFKEILRPVDFVARYGGEEFAILLLDTEKNAGIELAETLRRRIDQYPFPMEHSQPGGHLTISVGMAHSPTDAADVESLTRMADLALYRAKQAGRNRVEVW
jgi:diguanylate cyclase (GGDEF)-like protein